MKKINSIQKLLFLIYILFNKKLSTTEILSEYLKNNIKISRTALNNYLSVLIKNEINIKKEKYKNENIYSIPIKPVELNIDDETELIFHELKKIIISKKQYCLVKNALYLFYKLSSDFNEDSSKKIANFGYFSTLNWFLINELERHCFDKNVIQIEYILPNGKSKDTIIHADKLVIQGSSNRLYLKGTIGESFLFSYLPIDRIFMVKKVLREKYCFDLSVRMLKYTVLKKDFEKIGLLQNELISKKENDKVTILSLITDEFFTIQRIMEYCPDVYDISDKKIKDMVIEKLKTVEQMYEI